MDNIIDESNLSDKEVVETDIFDNYEKLAMIYQSANDLMNARLSVLQNETKVSKGYNPIHAVYSRVKTAESIYEKLKRRGLPLTVDSARKNLKDIAGVRIICNYMSDVYTVAKMLKKRDDMEVIEEKDYIKNPKSNGYRSCHMIFLIKVRLSGYTEIVPVEVQVRTIAMDFWASLEHKLRYKKDKQISDNLRIRLKACAEISNQLDVEMEKIEKLVEKMD